MGDITNIIVDDGLKKFSFTNKIGEVFAEFAFNPADTSIIERYNDTVEALTNMPLDKTEDVADKVVIISNTYKEQFNHLFNRNVSDGLFKVYSPVTILGNGELYAEFILDEIGRVIEKEFDTRLKKREKTMQKYTNKYHR